MESLMQDLKAKIIGQLNLQHLSPEQIGDDEPLFVDGLGLDSIDALELIVMLQQHYGIKIANPEEGPKIFRSVRSIAEYVMAHQKVG
ncbi:MAG: phosphopantetheine-binding protein [Thermoanaerobaculia bacterium]|nr:phosphopantetheine-binding protein [Thermoanaerobaculia bacterium]